MTNFSLIDFSFLRIDSRSCRHFPSTAFVFFCLSLVFLSFINANPTTASSSSEVFLCNNINEVRIGERCMIKRNYGRPCLQSRMCKTKGSLCLDTRNQESHTSPEAFVPKTAFCGCPFGSIYVQIKDECRPQTKTCLTNDNCELNYVCNDGICVCTYEDVEDHSLYLSKCIHNDTMESNGSTIGIKHPNFIHLCAPGQEATSRTCLQYIKREPFDGAVLDANWTLTLWKLLVLSTILISLMLLIRRVKKARMYDESIRLMYLQRDAALRARAVAVATAAGNVGEARQMAGSSNSASSLTLDLPPSYSEAITMKHHCTVVTEEEEPLPPFPLPPVSTSSPPSSTSHQHPPPNSV